MSHAVSIVMPAFRAERFIAASVRSLLAQTHEDWQLLLVADDGSDYRALLALFGIHDERIRFLATPSPRSGASRARNLGLEAITTPYAAVLDADDRFHPEKLARCVAALRTYPVVATALDVVDERYGHLRYVAAGPDRVLTAGEHKFVNFSMDSMIAWDCAVCSGRYDPDLPNMNDLDFLMRLWRTSPGVSHLGTPLHDYVKVKSSLSNSDGVTERMLAAKRLLLGRLAEGYYPFADPGAREGLEAFLRISLEAEQRYPAALAANPDALFEDTIEPLLTASRR